MRHPRLVQAGLDLIAAMFIGFAFAQATDPDMLFHVTWVVLTVQAFLFGLRASLLRIVAVGVAVVGYTALSGPEDPPLFPTGNILVSEWPLMLLIIVLVAVMADRVTGTGRRYAALYRQASDRLMTAQEDERRRLARDLHDGVGQTITALAFTLDAATASLATDERVAPRSVANLRKAKDLATHALEETRDVAGRLRPARLHERGLAAAVQELAGSAGAPIEVRVDEGVAQAGLLDAEREVEAYRIVQEAIANAVRHAAATRIWIDLRVSGNRLLAEVGDDGRGFARRRFEDRGLGIPGMHERAAMLGGTLTIASREGLGTRVRLTMPIAARGAARDETPASRSVVANLDAATSQGTSVAPR